MTAIAHYNLLERIGEGAFSEILSRARHQGRPHRRAEARRASRSLGQAMRAASGRRAGRGEAVASEYRHAVRRRRVRGPAYLAYEFAAGQSLRQQCAGAPMQPAPCPRSRRHRSPMRSPNAHTHTALSTRTSAPRRSSSPQGKRQAPRLRHGGLDQRRPDARPRRGRPGQRGADAGRRSVLRVARSRPSAAPSIPRTDSFRSAPSSTRC